MIETSPDPSTTTDEDAVIGPTAAVIVAVPADWPVTTPEIPTVATPLFDEDQVE